MASLSSGVTNHQNYDNTGKRKRSSSASPNVISSSSSSAVWTLLFNFSLFLICLFPCLLNNSSLNLNNNNVNNAGRGGGVGVSNYFVLFAEATPIEGNEEMSLNAGSTAASAGYLNDLNSSQQFGTASTGQEEYDNVAQNGDDAAAEAGDDNQANNANNESFVDNNNAEQNNKNGANQKKGVFRRFKDYVSKNKLFVGIGAAATATALIAGSYKLNCFPGNYYGDGRKQFEGLGDNATWKDQVKSFIPGTEANKKTGGVFSRLKNYLWKDNSPKDNSPNPQNGNNPQNPQNGNGNNPQGNPQNPQGNPQNTETPQTETPQTPTPVPSNPVPNPQGQDNPNAEEVKEPVKAPKPKAPEKPKAPVAPKPTPANAVPANGALVPADIPKIVAQLHPNTPMTMMFVNDNRSSPKHYSAKLVDKDNKVLVEATCDGDLTTYTDVTAEGDGQEYTLKDGAVMRSVVITRGDNAGQKAKIKVTTEYDGNQNIIGLKRGTVMGQTEPFFSYETEGNFIGTKDDNTGNGKVKLVNNNAGQIIEITAEVINGEQILTVLKKDHKGVLQGHKLKAAWDNTTGRPSVPKLLPQDEDLLKEITREMREALNTKHDLMADWLPKDDDVAGNAAKKDADKQMKYDVDGKLYTREEWKQKKKQEIEDQWKNNNPQKAAAKEAIEDKQKLVEEAQDDANKAVAYLQGQMNEVIDPGFDFADLLFDKINSDDKLNKVPWILCQSLDEEKTKKDGKPIWGDDQTDKIGKARFGWIKEATSLVPSPPTPSGSGSSTPTVTVSVPTSSSGGPP